MNLPVPVGPGDEAVTAGRILAVLRGLRGFTQRQLAEAAGMNKTAISDYETGKRPIPEPRRQRILAALGLPLRAWDDTVRHVEWLAWLAGEGPGGASDRRSEIQRIAETAGRDLERHLGDLLQVLAGPTR